MSKARERYKRAKRLAWAIVEIAQVSQEVAAGSLAALLWAAYARAQIVTPYSLLIGEAAERKIFGHMGTASLFPIKQSAKCFVCGGHGTTCEATASGILQPQTCVACKGSGNFEL